ncbi:hypothetical protein GCK72_016637 [Caenorhabditis remanei]|uniref:Uncharacterized protein n=1 Tax=Caenorhabditis remanei TaxID=31234 RepID=A0A6A5G5R8_CAERE|nr:hypothetical protein GCK72_016637 [Caenorhabditis remanei]KAF1750091.1 hypothetical protein GCK72_016637 [Caenorhabditis remanei]
MAPNQTFVLPAHSSDGQFDSVRTKTVVYAGKSKKTNPTSPTISEEDVFELKVKKEFPEYIERKKDKYTWKQFYLKRMEKKQKKQEEKMNKLVSKIGKSSALQQKSAHKTKLIEIGGSTSVKKFGSSSRLHSLSTSQASQKRPTTLIAITASVTKPRQVSTNLQGPTQIRRVSPVPVTRTFTPHGASTKKTAPLMRKALQMMKK